MLGEERKLLTVRSAASHFIGNKSPPFFILSYNGCTIGWDDKSLTSSRGSEELLLTFDLHPCPKVLSYDARRQYSPTSCGNRYYFDLAVSMQFVSNP